MLPGRFFGARRWLLAMSWRVDFVAAAQVDFGLGLVPSVGGWCWIDGVESCFDRARSGGAGRGWVLYSALYPGNFLR